MAKKIVGFIKLQIPAGKANPSPPVGPALGQLRPQQETQTFSTCAKSSSTGVARPKIVTDTRTFDFS